MIWMVVVLVVGILLLGVGTAVDNAAAAVLGFSGALVAGFVIFVNVMAPKSDGRGVSLVECVEGWQFIRHKRGDWRQLIDDQGHGVRCEAEKEGKR